MFVKIAWGNAWLTYRVVHGGQPKVGRIIVVQQADERGGGLRAIRGSEPKKVQVLRVMPGEVPELYVTWLKEPVGPYPTPAASNQTIGSQP